MTSERFKERLKNLADFIQILMVKERNELLDGLSACSLQLENRPMGPKEPETPICKVAGWTITRKRVWVYNPNEHRVFRLVAVAPMSLGVEVFYFKGNLYVDDSDECGGRIPIPQAVIKFLDENQDLL